MRLISKVAKLEAGAARQLEREPAAVGICYTSHEATIDPETLEDGEYIAVDVRVEGGPEDWAGRIPDALSEPPAWWSVTERVTCHAQDLGVVRDAEGVRVGRVVGLDGSMITVEPDELSPA